MIRRRTRLTTRALLLAALLLCACLLTSCAGKKAAPVTMEPVSNRSWYLRVVDEEPDTVDFQCTNIHYAVALNVFDRLVETQTDGKGNTKIVPSLAESWTVSDDGLKYTFRLRDGVKFSNGQLLTASDVEYTLMRMLTHPRSRCREIAEGIVGADLLESRQTDRLAGFTDLGDHTFSITLEAPFPAFLASLSMPPASILSEESVTAAGDAFGKDPAKTVGTGPFILDSWTPGEGMVLRANPDCWQGAPGVDGIELYYVTDEVEQRLMFERGELDILDLNKLGDEAEYFVHGDLYRKRLHTALQVDISYIALNQAAEPLNDVRVRRALQMSLDRQMILDALYAGRGTVENGIFPHALKGYNPDLEPIEYDPAGAVTLLAEAGYPSGFDLEIQVNASAGRTVRDLMTVAASMWKKIGVKATINVLPESEFMERRTTGAATCYTANWSADYNDPDNFIYTFFGSEDNTVYRSLNYPDREVIKRVQDARAILDEEERMKEYAALERKIIREDASWIPLFSHTHLYVTSERVGHFETAWNGTSQPVFRKITLK